MNTNQLPFQNLEATVWWWGTLKELPGHLRLQILNECIPLCTDEECSRYLRGAKLLEESQNRSRALSEHLVSDLKSLWRARPYFVICAFAAIAYMMVKGGVHLGRFMF